MFYIIKFMWFIDWLEKEMITLPPSNWLLQF